MFRGKKMERNEGFLCGGGDIVRYSWLVRNIFLGIEYNKSYWDIYIKIMVIIPFYLFFFSNLALVIFFLNYIYIYIYFRKKKY